MASTSKKRKISTRTYDEKLDIINFVDENPNMKKKDVAIKFGIPANTLTDILKKRDKIQNTLETTSDGKKDLKRVGQYLTNEDRNADMRTVTQEVLNVSPQ